MGAPVGRRKWLQKGWKKPVRAAGSATAVLPEAGSFPSLTLFCFFDRLSFSCCSVSDVSDALSLYEPVSVVRYGASACRDFLSWCILINLPDIASGGMVRVV